MTFSWSYVIILGGHLRETENKGNFQISDLKVLTVAEESQAVVAYDRVLETLFNWEAKRLFKSGRLREMVVMRELTVSYRDRDHIIHAHELYTLCVVSFTSHRVMNNAGLWDGTYGLSEKTGKSNFVQISLLSSQLLRDPKSWSGLRPPAQLPAAQLNQSFGGCLRDAKSRLPSRRNQVDNWTKFH